MKISAVTRTSEMSPLIMFFRRGVSASMCGRSTGEADGVTAAPEDEGQDEVEQHDGHDAQPDGAPDGDTHAGGTTAGVVAVVAVDQRDRHGEDHRFDEAVDDVLERQVQPEVVVVDAG